MEDHLAPAASTTSRPSVDWLSLGPASRLVGVDPDTLRRWADTGRIRAFTTPGGHRRFARVDLARVRDAGRAGRRSLATLGATAERVTQAYARSYRAGASASIPDVDAKERQAYRRDGRELVATILAYLDSASPERRTVLEDRASGMVRGTAERLAATGVPTRAAIEGFVAARQPILAALASLGRRQMLSAPAITALYSEAAALLDRLLLRFVDAFQPNKMET
jgi:excisionase family DNA binding protein